MPNRNGDLYPERYLVPAAHPDQDRRQLGASRDDTDHAARTKGVVVLLAFLLLLETAVAGVWIASLNEDRRHLLRIRDESWPRLGSAVMLMGESALDADFLRYSTLHRSAISEMGVLDECPLTEEEFTLIEQLRRVLTFAGFPNSLIWDNQSDLDYFGQGLWDIGDSIYLGHPHKEALARTLALIEDL